MEWQGRKRCGKQLKECMKKESCVEFIPFFFFSFIISTHIIRSILKVLKGFYQNLLASRLKFCRRYVRFKYRMREWRYANTATYLHLTQNGHQTNEQNVYTFSRVFLRVFWSMKNSNIFDSNDIDRFIIIKSKLKKFKSRICVTFYHSRTKN